ncbi:M14 family metallopeptidase [Clostridium tetani]|uniref:Gamma-D-glutamyl-L-diamino acid endopeptidase I n=1 Tax=Clostridium tetani (strain Massachusetts / E88) TaxID=212717 RepID=Q897X5_CLOTE|nr:M14 family zinc carboxypeptidase [Clostridium tetani]AAO35211.1 gamma-D-glutamyl-L-diamino acid endopeptidase I [Clostridium tetani E88]KGI38472.1 peptidase M14 [Clostridium tetani ATCC 9441]KGI40920.1 peptidase M14 [Clostridium tetani]KGI41591.1 peptidase M14 [Clostridium tetani]KGI43714.1 peptidase M14 [Clostridium tetani]
MELLKLGSRGPRVREVQSILKQMGYYRGTVDGIYGSQTEAAVRNFQKNMGLIADGIVGENTYRALGRYLSGYDVYTIRPGDTFYKIAKKYNTNLYSILLANPNIDPYNLQVGNEIIVPYGIPVVQTDIDYTYEILERDINGLKRRYPFIEVGSIGKSVLGRELYYLKLGNGPNKVFYNGAHHSLEWITTPLLMKFAENFIRSYAFGEEMRGYNIGDIWSRSTIYIVPMVNPDGVDLVLNGLKRDNPYYDELIVWNNGSTDFSTNWQANNRGVDLNHNYNASWQKSKDAEKEYGIYGPGPTRYSGPYPESEPETQAMVKFTREHDFRLTLAYHSQGEVIYWQYSTLTPPESERIVEIFAEVSGYTPSQTEGIASYAGYKDWFIEEFRRPGFTIEVGLGKNPLPISQFDKIYEDNEELLLIASVI